MLGIFNILRKINSLIEKFANSSRFVDDTQHLTMNGYFLSLLYCHLVLVTAFLGPYKSSKCATDTFQVSGKPSQADWDDNANKIEYVVGDGTSFSSLEALGLKVSSELTSRNVVPHHLVTGNELFCNVDLNMGMIEAIGFDMDWTLAQYTEDFDLLAYNGAKEKLVLDMGYPKDVASFVYRQDMSRRGLMIDKKRGNFIKMDRHKYVRVAEHGLTPMSPDERKQLYRETQTPDAFSSSNYASVDTPFSLVDACLYAQLVDLKDQCALLIADGVTETSGMELIASKSYEQLWKDMRVCVDRCHKDGVIKHTVAKDPAKYIVYDPNIFPMLKSFRDCGRKVFLATNSLWDYTNVVMNYLESRRSQESEGGLNLDWTSAFDVIFVGCNKPSFLTDDFDRNGLFRVDPATETLENLDFVPAVGASKEEVAAFLRADESPPRHIFQGGNAQRLHKMLQLSSGDKLLYVGDHIYSDVLRSKRTVGWRTCLIVPELTGEIMVHKKNRELLQNLTDLQKRQVDIEKRIDTLQIERLGVEGSGSDVPEEEGKLLGELSNLRVQKRKILAEYCERFHNRWGPLFKAGFQDSRFAKQVGDYACLYTSRASNLGLVGPSRPFRAVRDVMPHDSYLDEINK